MLRLLYMLIFAVFPVLFAAGGGTVLSLPPEQLTEVVRKTAMPELGNSRVAEILRAYYDKGLGGQESWDNMKSLSLIGQWKTKNGQYLLNTYHKKPNLMKVSLYQESAHHTEILAYDGKMAWQKNGSRAAPEPMPEADARRFIHNAQFVNHLLYPFAEGKEIRLIDTVPVEGNICHHLRVELDSEYQVDYYMDIRSYLVIKVVNTDLRSSAMNSFIYKNYLTDHGIPIARKVQTYEEGKWAGTLLVEEIKVNSGVMPWMFRMPNK